MHSVMKVYPTPLLEYVSVSKAGNEVVKSVSKTEKFFKALGAEIRSRREAKGWSLLDAATEAAAHAGVPQEELLSLGTIRNLEVGNCVPRLKVRAVAHLVRVVGIRAPTLITIWVKHVGPIRKKGKRKNLPESEQLQLLERDEATGEESFTVPPLPAPGPKNGDGNGTWKLVSQLTRRTRAFYAHAAALYDEAAELTALLSKIPEDARHDEFLVLGDRRCQCPHDVQAHLNEVQALIGDALDVVADQ